MKPADITKLLNRSTSRAIIDRGKAIYKSKGVKVLQTEAQGYYVKVVAEVQGSEIYPYNVDLEIRKDHFVSCNCNCPYDWSSICKHQAAVMFFLKTYLKEQNTASIAGQITTASKLKSRNTKEPVEIQYDAYDEYGAIDLDKYASSDKILQARRQRWLYNISFSIQKNQLVGLQENRAYAKKDKPVQVIITTDATVRKLYVKSLPNRRVKELSIEEIMVLDEIMTNTHEELLFFIHPESRKQMLLEHAEVYGITDPKIAEKFFKVDLDPYAENLIHQKEGTPKLLPMDNQLQSLSFINVGYKADAFFDVADNASGEDRSLLFYLDLNYINDAGYIMLSMNPFLARFKKNGEFYANSLVRYSDLQWHNRYRPDMREKDLIELSVDSTPDSLRSLARKKLAKLPEHVSEFQLLLRENFDWLHQLIKLTGEKDFELYIMDDSSSFNPYNRKLSPKGLAGPYPLKQGLKIEMVLAEKDGIYSLSPVFITDSGRYTMHSGEVEIFHILLIKVNDDLMPVNSIREAIILASYMDTGNSFAVFENRLPELLEKVVIPISRSAEVKIESLPKDIEFNEPELAAIQKAVYLSEQEQMIAFTPVMSYNEDKIDVRDNGSCLTFSNGMLSQIRRDREAEKQFMDFLIKSHPKFQEHLHHEYLGLSHQDFIKNYWFLDFMDRCEEEDIKVYGFNDFKKINFSPHRTKVISSASSGIDWFDVELSVTVGDEKVSLREVRKSVLAGHKYLQLGNGKLALLPQEWIKKLETYFRAGKVTKDKIQISKQRFNILEEVFNELNEPEILREIRAKKRKLKEFQEIERVSLPEVNATLRSYQIRGYEWLHFLNEFGWGGILSDDMGLGKTLQVITFLKSLTDRGRRKHLVVVPTSLLFNWQNEIEKFCPSLKYLIYHGTGRNRDTERWQDIDILLTSYGVLVSDFETFKDQKFDYCILDESQAIKNPLSKRYKAAVSIKAQNKLAMTGTPIENNTFDLYAQMNFVNPGLFLSKEAFREQYANPIDKDGDQAAASELNKLIDPFVLRRTKELVAKELPPKTESVIYCEMEKEQRKVYDAFRNEYRNEIIGMIEEQGIEKSQMHILQALTKLRQICDSPALLSDRENYGSESAKIKELVNHIREKTGNHKLLIFSQFVNMLQLIKSRLEEENILFSYLDGQTSQKNRKQAVIDFQEKEEVRVFLISLKAGGTGLNLTAADYVYIVDPWWNPAVENQAIDRCYRIGQDKKVIAYRMICKDTLEEKIMDYKAKKQNVADAIVRTDESVMKQLSRDDMLNLFA